MGSVYQIGIDFGGTKIEIIILDPNDRPLFRKREKTPTVSHDNYAETIQVISRLVNEGLKVLSNKVQYSIGVGIPGTFDKASGIVQNANTTWLAEKPFCRDLENTLGQKVYMDNDANCFTLAEAAGGAAKGFNMVFGIIMGTGCGGGICMNGILHSGLHGIAGEWGHFSIDPGGEMCFCGNRGCIDTLLTGPALVRAFEKESGQRRSAEKIVESARKGDLSSARVFEKFLDNFGRGVGGVISLLDPDVVVIGGGLSNIPELYTVGIEKVKKYAFHKNITTPIIKNKLGDSAGVFGAAWLPHHS